ncbi:hypothetical protein FACHB389_32835 [Nostoc calcicola FACHB-389]|nr:hypothetical protein [Nostoc calcicola FACHB-3891]OKH20375.1 hypothetical protein FACHB389_32835 [Nostoc calcicola FACHB-389]
MGENILPAIEEVAFKHQQPYLKQQYKLRQQRAEEYAGTEQQNLYKYFALVKAPGMSAKLVTLPLEGTYDFVPTEDNQLANSFTTLTNDIDVKAYEVNNSSSLETEEKKNYSVSPMRWHNNAAPEILVNSAMKEILCLIQNGYIKPLDICREIWGEINTQAKPYNGKRGVKVRIEYLIKSHSKINNRI